MKIYLTGSQVCSCSSAQFGPFCKLWAFHLSRSPQLMNYWNFKKYIWLQSFNRSLHKHICDLSRCQTILNHLWKIKKSPQTTRSPRNKSWITAWKFLKQQRPLSSGECGFLGYRKFYYCMHRLSIPNDVSACNGSLVELFQQLQQELCHAVHTRW